MHFRICEVRLWTEAFVFGIHGSMAAKSCEVGFSTVTFLLNSNNLTNHNRRKQHSEPIRTLIRTLSTSTGRRMRVSHDWFKLVEKVVLVFFNQSQGIEKQNQSKRELLSALNWNHSNHNEMFLYIKTASNGQWTIHLWMVWCMEDWNGIQLQVSNNLLFFRFCRYPADDPQKVKMTRILEELINLTVKEKGVSYTSITRQCLKWNPQGG